MRAVFEKFDANKSGKLDYGELQEALKAYGIDSSVSYAQEKLRKHDTVRPLPLPPPSWFTVRDLPPLHPPKDWDGLLDIHEFSELCRELPRVISDGYRKDYEALQARQGSGYSGDAGRVLGKDEEYVTRLERQAIAWRPFFAAIRSEKGRHMIACFSSTHFSSTRGAS